jgi:hypothetical protein
MKEATITLSYEEFESLKKYKDEFDKLTNELKEEYNKKLVQKTIMTINYHCRHPFYSDHCSILTDDEATIKVVKQNELLQAELKSFVKVSTWRSEPRYKKIPIIDLRKSEDNV